MPRAYRPTGGVPCRPSEFIRINGNSVPTCRSSGTRTRITIASFWRHYRPAHRASWRPDRLRLPPHRAKAARRGPGAGLLEALGRDAHGKEERHRRTRRRLRRANRGLPPLLHEVRSGDCVAAHVHRGRWRLSEATALSTPRSRHGDTAVPKSPPGGDLGGVAGNARFPPRWQASTLRSEGAIRLRNAVKTFRQTLAARARRVRASDEPLAHRLRRVESGGTHQCPGQCRSDPAASTM